MDKRAITKRSGKTTFIAMAILFSCIALIFMASAVPAQDEKKERGYNGRITIKELLSKFERGEIVEGYVIEGDDIIEIIRKTDHKIQIINSVIKGSLDFTKLPPESLNIPVPLDKIELPKNWDEERRAAFKKGREAIILPVIFKVKNKVEITKSELRSKDKDAPSVSKGDFDDVSINAAGALFYDEVEFTGTIFNGIADFRLATFSGESRILLGAHDTLGGGPVLYKAIWHRDNNGNQSFVTSDGEIFRDATFRGKAYFMGAIFSEGVGFYNATFDVAADFSLVTFRGGVDFNNATFRGEADFRCATFTGETHFQKTTFNKLVSFRGKRLYHTPKETRFDDILFIESAVFKEYADFRDTHIRRLNYKNTIPGIVEGSIDFRNATISEAYFQDIIFEKDIDFSDVKFSIPLEKGKQMGKLATVFRYVTFESDANFIRAEFHSDTVFERIKFKRDANFTDIAFKDFKRGDTKRFSLSYLTFKHLLLSMDDLPDIQHWVREDKDRIQSFADVKNNKANKTGEENLQPLTNVLNNLEDVFHSQNNLYDTNKAYYYRKLMELEDIRLMRHVDTSRNKTFWRRVWREVQWCFWGVQCGYATSLVKILSWCGGFYLFFVILYSTGGKLTKTHQKEEDEFKLRLFVLPRKYFSKSNESKGKEDHEKGWGKFIGALKLSMVIFFKIGYLDAKISGKLLRIDAKWFVRAEWVIGYYLLAALVVTLSNTVPIVHRLISGIF